MRSHMDQLMPLIMRTLQDQGSTSKREVALHTLGHLAESTGYVVEPFVQVLIVYVNLYLPTCLCVCFLSCTSTTTSYSCLRLTMAVPGAAGPDTGRNQERTDALHSP